MSSYKSNYTPWNKSTSKSSEDSYSTSLKKDSSSSSYNNYTSKGVTRLKNDVPSKTSGEKSVISKIALKHNSSLTGKSLAKGNEPEYSSERSSGSNTSNKYNVYESRESKHPPISYRPITKNLPRSRDPSPAYDTSQKDSNKLPQRTYTRSLSTERTDISPSLSITPKYTRSLSNKEMFNSRKSNLGDTKQPSSFSQYLNKSDVPSTSQPFSYSEHLCNKKTRLPSSNSYSSVGKESYLLNSKTKDTTSYGESPTENLRYKSSRSLSKEDLSLPSQKYINSRFLPKNTIEKSYTAYSRQSNVSRCNEVCRKNKELLNALHAQQKQAKIDLSNEAKLRNSKNKLSLSTDRSISTSRSTSPLSSLPKRNIMARDTCIKSNPSSPSDSKKDNLIQTEEESGKGNSNESKSRILLSDRKVTSLNKDFRKSILNMNPAIYDKEPSKHSSLKNSGEGEAVDTEATDVSESLDSCTSYHKSIPTSTPDVKHRDSPSSDTNSSTSTISSSSKEETKSNGSGKIKSSESLNRSIPLTPTDDSGCEKSLKPPIIPRSKSEKSDHESKSILSRVGNLFKSPENSHWKNSSNSNGKSNQFTNLLSEKRPLKNLITRIESGERAWWLDDNASPTNTQTKLERSASKHLLRHVDSGEMAWWLDSNSEIPEGIEVFPNANAENQTSLTESNNTSSYDEKNKLEVPKNRNFDSDERSWWKSSSENNSATAECQPKYTIQHDDSSKGLWLLNQSTQDTTVSTESDLQYVLGDRASPDGLETPKEILEHELNKIIHANGQKDNNINYFISKHTNIDDLLGNVTQLWSVSQSYESNNDKTQRADKEKSPLLSQSKDTKNLDDAALQLYKDGDYGAYLDLEASISEQQEEFDCFQLNKKNSIVLRTQLSVRVHSIIEKLFTSDGKELRRALFSLKQIFQGDKDLVHEFVQNDGLACLIKVGSEADQNYQNYILRALGQVMLYVDGMHGVIEHNETIQWLYSLVSSKFRLVVKTALKLLLVFIEYTDSNCQLVIQAIHTVDYSQSLLPYYNLMKLLKDFESADTELLIYATTLINKILNNITDQDVYYDQVDVLEEQGMEGIIQRYMTKPGTDLDLLQQFQIYEAVLQFEDSGTTPFIYLDDSVKKNLRNRKPMIATVERRKSSRLSTGTPSPKRFNIHDTSLSRSHLELTDKEGNDNESSSSQSSDINKSQLNGGYKDTNKAIDVGVTPALKRRRERAERQRSFMKQQEVATQKIPLSPGDHYDLEEHHSLQQRIAANNVLIRNCEEVLSKQQWILPTSPSHEKAEEFDNTSQDDRDVLLQLKRENTVKDLTQKLVNQKGTPCSTLEDNILSRIGDMTGLISKAKEGLAKSKSKADVQKSAASENIVKPEIKKSENELRWEELVVNMDRPLNLCDMDFTDLVTDDDNDVLTPATIFKGVPPPPPPLRDLNVTAPPPPPLSTPPPLNVPLQRATTKVSAETKLPVVKNKKTVKLFWKEVREESMASKLKTGYIWDELSPVPIDTQKLEHLFESRAKDVITKKQQELNKNKEIIVLDPKRSNAINIGITKLPPPRSIKTAILKMDATIMNREGIEKLLTMLPTEEERTKIQDAQAANPDLPLGSAEQFLLTLASISELTARLKLWAFKLDFENSEREIAEPLMDLKQGFEVLKVNKTFRAILSTLLSIGNFLNGNEVKGFQIEYLSKVPEVKDTVHKHSLLHHLCHIIMETFPEATDLYSEIGAVTRASKIDFEELIQSIQRLESDCKSSWDYLKVISKHDGSTIMKVKMSDFLTDCAERIILLGIIQKRIINRFHKFLLWLGTPLHHVSDIKPNVFCRIVSEFALEYRTTRERVLQQLEKKANHRERNKTRGKMITDMGKFRTKEDRADAELRQLLGSDMSDAESIQGTLPWRRTKRVSNHSFLNTTNGNLTDGDDEILESLVKTATKGPARTTPRERKRTRHADRKSLRRTLKNGLSDEEKKYLSTSIKGY